MNELIALSVAIEKSGLTEIAKSSPAYDMMESLITTGTFVQIDDDEHREEAESMALTLSDPRKWGLGDNPAWSEFLQSYGE